MYLGTHDGEGDIVTARLSATDAQLILRSKVRCEGHRDTERNTKAFHVERENQPHEDAGR